MASLKPEKDEDMQLIECDEFENPRGRIQRSAFDPEYSSFGSLGGGGEPTQTRQRFTSRWVCRAILLLCQPRAMRWMSVKLIS